MNYLGKLNSLKRLMESNAAKIFEVKKTKGLETIELGALRNVVNEGGEEVIKNFGDKYRELRVKPIRNNTFGALYMLSNAKLLYQDNQIRR